MKEALASGKVKRYVADFLNAKSANTEAVIAISHLDASTEESEDNCAMMAANQIVKYIEEGNIINSVNYPNLCLGPKEGTRVVVLHEASLDGNLILDEVKSKTSFN